MDSKSVFLDHILDRRSEFRPNPLLDENIGELRQLLEPLQLEVDQSFEKPRLPVVLVVGCPRSGTTLLTQLLAATGNFSYPSNVLSRFAYAPYVGAKIQQMLFQPEYDYRNELGGQKAEISYLSTLGRSKGALSVNEFFHFWRRFLPGFDPQFIEEEALNRVDFKGLRSELASIEYAFGKPFMGKGMMLQFNIPDFVEKIPELFFINIVREPTYVMQSIYQSRLKYYGDENIWWSLKPAEYDGLSKLDVERQIAGQVYFVESAISLGLDQLSESQSLTVNYEELCGNPKSIYAQLRERLNACGSTLSEHYVGPDKFEISNEARLPTKIIDQLADSYDQFKQGQFKQG